MSGRESTPCPYLHHPRGGLGCSAADFAAAAGGVEDVGELESEGECVRVSAHLYSWSSLSVLFHSPLSFSLTLHAPPPLPLRDGGTDTET